MKFLLSLFTLLMVTNSCDSSKKAIEKKNMMQETLSGTYTITKVINTDVSAKELIITFDDTTNKVTGFAGCNRFFGSYSVQNNTINFSNIGSSKKYCGKEIMTLEDTVLKSLKSTTSFSTNDNTISFLENDTVLIQATNTIITAGKSAVANYENKIEVKYQALSRNSFDFILISKSNILISKDKNLQDVEKYPISAEDWEAINKLIEAVDTETIKNLEPPSKKHQFDGAPHTTLAIIQGDVEYMTPTFDQGNPPEEILALVNKVLSIKENAVKQ